MSNGVCFLGFSRGKDAICAWLNLKRYFRKIIPFHACNVPNLSMMKESLDYYEYEFGEHIYRMQDGDIPFCLVNGIYQRFEDDEFNQQFDGSNWTKLDILEYLRYKLNLPRAWCAFGINMCDSLERRCSVMACQGRHDKARTFYPTWDWPREEILKCVEESGIKLADDYNHFQGTFTGIPTWAQLNKLKKYYPEDYEKVKMYLPLCEAELARQHFRKEMNAVIRAKEEKNEPEKAE